MAGRPDGIRWRRGRVAPTSVTLPLREEAGVGQVFLLPFVATGPTGGKPAELPGLAPVPWWDLLPRSEFPSPKLSCLQQLVLVSPGIQPLPSTSGLRVPAQIWLLCSPGMLLGPVLILGGQSRPVLAAWRCHIPTWAWLAGEAEISPGTGLGVGAPQNSPAWATPGGSWAGAEPRWGGSQEGESWSSIPTACLLLVALAGAL